MGSRIAAVSNEKGGVGKTTSCVNIGKNVSGAGRRVLMIDNDPQGDLSKALVEDWQSVPAQTLSLYDDEGVTPYQVSENLHLIASNKQMTKVEKYDFECIYVFAERVQELAKSYDYVLIDCPPNAGTFTTAAFSASDRVLIPITVSKFATSNLDELLDTLAKVKKRINPRLKLMGLINNLRPQQYTKLEKAVIEQIHEHFPEMLFESGVSRAIRVEESHFQRMSVHEYAPGSKQDHEYLSITKEFLRRFENG